MTVEIAAFGAMFSLSIPLGMKHEAKLSSYTRMYENISCNMKSLILV